MDDRTPSDDELREMEAMVADSIERGIVGFLTGLDYTPQCHAATEKVQRLAGRLAPFGFPFVAHIRGYHGICGTRSTNSSTSEQTKGYPCTFLTSSWAGRRRDPPNGPSTSSNPHASEASTSPPTYPYVPGSGSLFALLPQRFHSLPEDELRVSLEDEAVRNDLIQSLGDSAGPWDLHWDVVVCHVAAENSEALLGQTVREAAAEHDQYPAAFACDVLLENDFQVGIVNIADRTKVREADIQAVLVNRLVGIGSNGIFGKKPHPRTYTGPSLGSSGATSVRSTSCRSKKRCGR